MGFVREIVNAAECGRIRLRAVEALGDRIGLALDPLCELHQIAVRHVLVVAQHRVNALHQIPAL